MNHLPLLLAAIGAALAVLIAWIARSVFLGYPRSALQAVLLTHKEQAIVSACADALFPPGGPIPVSGTEAGLVGYMDRYLERLPRLPRLLARLLLLSVEHGPWVFGPRPARFTRLKPVERVAMLRAMARSSLYFRRISFLSLRTMMTMGYLAHPEVARRMHIVPDAKPFEHAVTSGVTSGTPHGALA
jgi:hypothetical protein